MYCSNLLKYKRRKTIEVNIASTPLGGNNPVRIQSMTNTKTIDTEATVEQTITLYKAGSEYVRITAPTIKDAENFAKIKKSLQNKGYKIPLIADIHFSPKAAEISAEIIDKVRINPGNYTDKKRLSSYEYTDEEYKIEASKIKDKFVPLLYTCKKNNTAIRIGTNHGSLSDRIMSKYGDTPLGMVESTMEFLRICVEENFSQVVISMKASNPIIMIHATRLLVDTMNNEGMSFPIHLGVTEAGSESEGRIKSAVGISSLLADGIGDTIRVSLTEAPEKELPVANLLANLKFANGNNTNFDYSQLNLGLFEYIKRETFAVKNIGGDNHAAVISDFSSIKTKEGLNLEISKTLIPDYIFVEKKTDNVNYKGIGLILDIQNYKQEENTYPLFNYKSYINSSIKNKELNFIEIDESLLSNLKNNELKNDNTVVYILNTTQNESPVHHGRSVFYQFLEKEIKNPIIIKAENSFINDKFLVESSAATGPLFIDGFGNGIFIKSSKEDIEKQVDTSFSILQACRARISKTEYISCPSCGRTLFDLEEATAKIKSRTSHLVGLKIGIMGCIVNGPGEMADADYGYVGSGYGKIDLFKGKEVIKRNISEKNAVDELLNLIEKHFS